MTEQSIVSSTSQETLEFILEVNDSEYEIFLKTTKKSVKKKNNASECESESEIPVLVQ